MEHPSNDLKRIALSNEAYSKLESKVNELKAKGDHFKVNESRLANLIVEVFFSKYIEKEIKYIESKCFDKKNYLKYLITNSASEAELQASIDEFLKSSKSPRGRKPKVNRTNQEPSK